jgi:hypothetical protein
MACGKMTGDNAAAAAAGTSQGLITEHERKGAGAKPAHPPFAFAAITLSSPPAGSDSHTRQRSKALRDRKGEFF